ncbi:RNA pyrophosphohydrolase [Telmatospirillum siberiense]|uniref:RNA pyrophosphohydrolase n=1 Tax=Telmatospirillum siberiense TaxID=382514 RepID=A0A2N3PMG3_9PROT|nr:RNA pyrophosphohydrolase [Telmatospirillum siberiense]PKU21587.1 RNA pyrophosphohydrolase [Telmatospirillum siberiense]
MHGPTGYRSGIGIVLMNRQGRVFVGHRKDGRDPPWQMPQGGMQPGEPPEQAALRELKEELGTDRAVVIATCPHWLRYDYPKAASTKRALLFRGQRHKWFLMRFTGNDGDIVVETEHPEFSSWRWMAPDEVVANVISFKRDVYRVVMQQFAPFLGHMQDNRQAAPISPVLITPSRQHDLRG